MKRELIDSNIEWLGKIPTNWIVQPLKRVIKERNELNKSEKETFLLSLTIQDGIIPYSEKNGGGNKAKEDISKYKIVKKNDIVINSMNVVVGASGISKYDGLVSPVYYVFSETNKSCGRFYNYLFLNQTFENHLFGLGNGILVKINEDNGKLNTIRKKIPIDKLKNEFVPVPPLEEQIKISNYLDDKVSLIDETIENNKKEIKLLEEYKKNYSTELFTKLLGKYSSIKIKKMCSKISKGETPKDMLTEFNDEYCYRFLKCENLVNREVLPVPLFTISSTTYNNMKRSQLEVNDILFVIAGATIGKTAILTEDMLPSNTNQAISFIRLNDKCDINVKYVEHFLNTRFIDDVILLNSVQSAQPNISMEDLGNIKIPIVGIEEKEMIVNNIDNITKKLNRVIDYRKNIIEKLEEYKKSLIYEVVTGKIEV